MKPGYEPSSLPMTGARCALHVETPATAICSRCGAYACLECSRLGPMDLDYCQDCIAQVTLPQLATRNSRAIAHLVDNLVVSLPMFLAMGVALFLVLAQVADEERRFILIIPLFTMGLVMVLGLTGYQTYRLVQTGQSIGKRLMGIRVVRSDGSQADFVRAVLLRNGVPFVISFVFGFFSLIDWFFIYGRDQRCLHDLIADTMVVKVEEDPGVSTSPFPPS